MAQRSRPPVGARPGVVTVAALVLAGAGAAAVLDAIILVAFSSIGAFDVAAIVLLAVGALEVFAATQVFELRERGRRLGITMSVLAVVLDLVLLGKGTILSILGIAAGVFVIYVLYANREYFAG